MALKIWLPLNGSLKNQGFADVTITNNGATIDDNGKIGKCYYFDGSDDRITISNFSIGNVWSYCFWIYSATSSRSWEGVLILNSNGGDTDMQLGMYTYPGGNRIQNTANGQYNSSIPFTYGQWNHFCGTFDGNNLKTYINGNLVNTKAITEPIKERSHLTIGARCRGDSGFDCFFQGKLNDVRIYNHCLSPLEIKKLSQGLVLHYRLSGIGQENLFTATPCYGGNRNTLIRNGNGVKIDWTLNPGDTYWYLRLANGVTLTEGDTYTLSFQCSGIGDASVTFRWCNLVNYDLYIHNGWNQYTFSMPATNINNPFFDDINRDTTLSDVQFWDFKLEKGEKATPWIPAPTDPLYTTLGLNDNVEYDCSGYGYNGTITGTYSSTSDTSRYTTSRYTGGTMKITRDSISSEIKTISFWAKILSKSTQIAFVDYNSGLGFGFWDGNYILPVFGSWNSTTYSINDFELNKWNHICIVRDSYPKLYINGEEKTALSYTNNWSATVNALNIGSRNGNYPLTGYLSDFRMYATRLSDEDIKALYNLGGSLDNNGVFHTYELQED